MEIVEEREYENTLSCDHVYEKKCHTTFVTKFKPQQIEKCDEDYKKDCQIEFNTVTENKTQTVCHEKLFAENCEETGNDGELSECRTEFETECITEEEHVQVYSSKHTSHLSHLLFKIRSPMMLSNVMRRRRKCVRRSPVATPRPARAMFCLERSVRSHR